MNTTIQTNLLLSLLHLGFVAVWVAKVMQLMCVGSEQLC